jgi:hypothetical protein
MDSAAEYSVGNEWRTITQDDYQKGAGVAPISDPTMVSDMQIMARAQFLLSFKDDPRMNGVNIMMEAFKAVKIEHPERFFNTGPMMPSPEIMLMAKDLDIKATRFQAQSTLDIARSVHALSRAAMETGAPEVDQLTEKVEALHQQLNQQGASQQQSPQNPPIPGARQAPDGKWYVPDPHRKGKYLLVNSGGQ